jgi:carbamoyl-phosphate synthase large subunit
MSLKILFLGGGRKVALANNFIFILKKKYNVKLFSYEIDSNNSFSKIGKIIIGKKWNNPSIINHLAHVIKKFKIDLVIACTDPATIVLAKLKKSNKNLKIISSPVNVVKICLDKLKLHNFLKINNNKINQIPLAQKKFPIFAKPRTGSASVGVFKIKNKSDMNKLLLNINPKNYIFQKFLNGKEYTVDVYINNNGIVEGIVARERVRVLHGESIFIKTFQIKKINIEVKKILRVFNYKFRGPITIQFIKYKKKFFLLEINPRISGGINASIFSGLNLPFYLAKDYFNLKIKYKFKFKAVKMIKYFEEIRI